MSPRSLPISARFFLLAFVPISVVMVGGFVRFRAGIEDAVREGLRRSLMETQQAQTNLRLEARRQRLTLLAAVAENASLKAGLGLWRENRDEVARRTLHDQLLEMSATLDADLVGLRDANGGGITALVRRGSRWEALGKMPPEDRRLSRVGNEIFELLEVPVNTGPDNIGLLLVGKRFEAGSFHRQAVLVEGKRVVGSAGLADVSGWTGCAAGQACTVSLAGGSYLALPVDATLLDRDHAMWTLHSVDAAAAGLLGSAQRGFWVALVTMLLATSLAGIWGSRSVAQPLTALIARLRESERSGVLHGDFPEQSSTREVNELGHAFNLAARSVADSQRRLDEAYLQITQTMAQTLDARDAYTAGHSSRVSEYAAAIAGAMKLPEAERETIRVGAVLHDIGKIGIPDAVLQKAGPLTGEEYEVIKKHPVIGKRILEGVAKFRDYLSIVELHHENPDGTGYPWGLRGDDVPLGARIVHVVDAYDAMTTSRPYRKAMPPEKAQAILQQKAGTQFDAAVVETFLRLVRQDPQALPAPEIGPQLATLGEKLIHQHENEPVH